MGPEIYAGTIWAALAFKLQSSGEMGNDNGIKIKRVSNWPSQWEVTGRCCAVGSRAVIRMWERAVPTHWVHQAGPDMIRVGNDNRKMRKWREESAHVQTFELPNQMVCGLLWRASRSVLSGKQSQLSPGDVGVLVRRLRVPEVSKLPAIWKGR